MAGPPGKAATASHAARGGADLGHYHLILKDRAEGDTQPIGFKVDPGSKTTGIALVGEFPQQGRVVLFQEYLAACHLANTEPGFAVKLRELVWQDLTWWREVFLLEVGKKWQGGLSDAINVLNTLIPQAPAETDAIEARHWQAAVLAGEALLELRVPVKEAEQPHYQAILRRLRQWLRQLIDTGQLAPRERLSAGDVLGRLGDPRPGSLRLAVNFGARYLEFFSEYSRFGSVLELDIV